MGTDIAVWPDAERGLLALLNKREMLDLTLKPTATPTSEDFHDDLVVVIQLETIDSRESDVDRTQEIRLTVYGPSRYESSNLFEAILSFISGEDVETPPLHNWPGYYFDKIERLRGPSFPAYPDTTISPAVGTVRAIARPMA